jgi:N-acetylneuraminic acid mutarotase
MKKTTLYYSLWALFVAGSLSLVSCEDEDNVSLLGNWVEEGIDFPGTRRGGAVCFQIGNTAYVGTGANTNKTEEKERYRDFYKCEVKDGAMSWTPRWDRTMEGITSMPDAAAPRNGAVAFSINGKGYVGLGYDGTNYLKDFWEFDPNGTPKASDYPSIADSTLANIKQTGSWKKIADYPGDSCRYAVAFVIDNIAYVGTGEDYDDNILSDFYKFDGKKWTPISSIGKPRAQAMAFVHDGKGYVVGGVNNGAVDWFEMYDPKTDTWDNKTLHRVSDRTDYEFDDDYKLASYGGTAFVLPELGKAYITTGGAGYAGNATWEYDLAHDYWVQKTSFEGSPRKFAVSFTLDLGNGRTTPFVTTGTSSDITITGSGGNFYSDIWSFDPFEWYEDKD